MGYLDFNDTSSSKEGLIQVCETKLFGGNYGEISGSAKRLATFSRLMNAGLNRYTNLAMQSETRWQFHDSNYLTHPEAYTTMTAGQSDYGLSELHLQLRHVYVKNSDGKKVPLKPVDEYDFATHGVAPEVQFETDGMPQYYDKKGRSIRLYPAPSAADTTLTNGLYVTYTSAPSYFDPADTTKEAGIPLVFQDYPAIYASWKYSNDNQMKKKSDSFKLELLEMESDIKEFYAMRDRDDRPQLRVRRKSYV